MRVNLLHVLRELAKQIASSRNLITKVRRAGLPGIQVEIVAELAFLRVFMAWECFLEESFIRYLLEAKSPSGYTPKRFVKPPNIKKAIEIILGENRDYASWNSASKVRNRAKIYFKDGEPYETAMITITRDSDEMNTIRNRIAHKSKKSREKFNDLILGKFGHGIQGMTPGRLLLRPISSSSHITFFDYYVGIITVTSRIIIP
ncbi:MAG: hypothetical protein KJI70_00405 [Patescibacteria group bacterium]|nr:hypothetical protein [Patescibacteria group bacterium]